MAVKVADTMEPMGDGNFPVVAANNVSGLATVATSGNYNDLTNKPSSISNAEFAQKIGTSSNYHAIGSDSLPVYINSSGNVNAIRTLELRGASVVAQRYDSSQAQTMYDLDELNWLNTATSAEFRNYGFVNCWMPAELGLDYSEYDITFYINNINYHLGPIVENPAFADFFPGNNSTFPITSGIHLVDDNGNIMPSIGFVTGTAFSGYYALIMDSNIYIGDNYPDIMTNATCIVYPLAPSKIIADNIIPIDSLKSNKIEPKDVSVSNTIHVKNQLVIDATNQTVTITSSDWDMDNMYYGGGEYTTVTLTTYNITPGSNFSFSYNNHVYYVYSSNWEREYANSENLKVTLTTTAFSNCTITYHANTQIFEYRGSTDTIPNPITLYYIEYEGIKGHSILLDDDGNTDYLRASSGIFEIVGQNSGNTLVKPNSISVCSNNNTDDSIEITNDTLEVKSYNSVSNTTIQSVEINNYTADGETTIGGNQVLIEGSTPATDSQNNLTNSSISLGLAGPNALRVEVGSTAAVGDITLPKGGQILQNTTYPYNENNYVQIGNISDRPTNIPTGASSALVRINAKCMTTNGSASGISDARVALEVSGGQAVPDSNFNSSSTLSSSVETFCCTGSAAFRKRDQRASTVYIEPERENGNYMTAVDDLAKCSFWNVGNSGFGRWGEVHQTVVNGDLTVKDGNSSNNGQGSHGNITVEGDANFSRNITVSNATTNTIDLGNGTVTIRKGDIQELTSCPTTMHNDYTGASPTANTIGIGGLILLCIRCTSTSISELPAGTKVVASSSSKIYIGNSNYSANVYPATLGVASIGSSVTTGNLTVTRVESLITSGTYYLITNCTHLSRNYWALAIRTA